MYKALLNIAALSLLNLAATAQAQEVSRREHPMLIQCRNGYKYGENRGEIVRGWTCQYRDFQSKLDRGSEASQSLPQNSRGTPP